MLLSPHSVKQPLLLKKSINVVLSRQQVKESPDIDIPQPISRQHEKQVTNECAYFENLSGDEIWSAGQCPILPLFGPNLAIIDTASAKPERDGKAADIRVRDSDKVTGYNIQTSDGGICYVLDFVFDEASLGIRYLVVDKRNCCPRGKKMLLAKYWINHINWHTKAVHVSLHRDQIKNGPEFAETTTIERAYEKRLHNAHNSKGYRI